MACGKWRLRPLHKLWLVCSIVLLLGAVACQGDVRPEAAPASSAMVQVTSTQTPSPRAAGATPALPPDTPASTAGPTVDALVPTAASATIAANPTPAASFTSTPAPAAPPVVSDLPVRIVIPDLKLDAKVVQMGWTVVQTANGPSSDWVIPEYEAGHHINSAALGEPGNLVISGHNNIYGKVFRPISLAWNNDQRMKIDDFTDGSDALNGRTIELFDAAGKQFDYTITAFYRLKDTGVPLQQRIANARFIQPTDSAQLTLITCWPPSSNTHRLIVIAKPAS